MISSAKTTRHAVILVGLIFTQSLSGIATADLDRLQKNTVQAQQAYDAGRYLDAEKLYLSALSQSEANENSDGYLAVNLNGLANVYRALARYTEAERLFDRTLKIRQESLGPDHPDVAKALQGLGFCIYIQGRHTEAQSLLERALQIFKTHLGPEHLEVAYTLNHLADLYLDMAQADKAEQLYHHALAIKEKTLGPDHVDLAETLIGLGILLLNDREKIKEAEPLFLRAKRILEQTEGSAHPQLARCFYHMGQLYHGLGQFRKAVQFKRRALEIQEKTLGPEHNIVATTLNCLASLLEHSQGRYVEAERLFRRSLAIREKIFGSHHPDIAQSLILLAWRHKKHGRFRQAEYYYRRGLAIQKKTLGPNHPDASWTLHGLASLYHHQKRLEEAESAYTQSLEIRKSIFGPDHQHVAWTLVHLASVYRDQGRFDQAMQICQRALAIHKQKLGIDHPNTALNLTNLAQIHREQKRYDQAESLYLKALRIQEHAYGLEHVAVTETLTHLVQLYRDQGQHDQALSYCHRALLIAKTYVHRLLPVLTPNERVTLASDQRRYLAQWLAVTRETGSPDYKEVLQFKGLVTRATEVEWYAARNNDAQTKQLLADLRMAHTSLGNLSKSAPHEPDKLDAWKQLFAQTSQRCENLSRRLVNQSTPYRKSSARLQIQPQDLQTQLKPFERLVDFVRYGDRYAAWLVSPLEKGEPIRVELGNAQTIDDAIHHFRDTVIGSPRRGVQAAQRSGDPVFLQAGHQLHDLIWKPLRPYLDDAVTTLYLVPDAAFATLPFAALPINSPTNNDQDQFLVDRYTLAHLSFAQDLIPWETPRKSGKGLLAIGGVDYDHANLDLPNELRNETTNLGELTFDLTRTTNLQRSAPGEAKFTSLLASGLEVEAVVQQFNTTFSDEPSLLIQGPHATEHLLRQLAPGQRILHLATHGYIDEKLPSALDRQSEQIGWMQLPGLSIGMEHHLSGYNPMLLSYLVMAGFNERSGGGDDDGALTALETSSLNLEGVELAVLSACNTAGGTVRAGEGVLGLVRGFKQAGVHTVVASLWPVSDRATKKLMDEFYPLVLSRDLAQTPAAALRSSSIALRRLTMNVQHKKASQALGEKVVIVKRPLNAPKYWAAFVAYGPLR